MTTKELLNRFKFTFYDDWAFAGSGEEFLTADRQKAWKKWDNDPDNLPHHKMTATLTLTAQEWMDLMNEISND